VADHVVLVGRRGSQLRRSARSFAGPIADIEQDQRPNFHPRRLNQFAYRQVKPGQSMSAQAKIVLSWLTPALLLIVGPLALAACGGGGNGSSSSVAAVQTTKTDLSKRAELKAERDRLQLQQQTERKRRQKDKRAEGSHARRMPAASAGAHDPAPRQAQSSEGSTDLTSSFAALESEVGGEIGVAFAPLGSQSIQSYGGVAVDHAWSSFKVPIIVTLMAEQGPLSSEQESLAVSAITASDNAAAAGLFSDLEDVTGGAAAQTIEAVISQLATGRVEVTTAPPPPGAYSSWGQTNWTIQAATAFYGAMACGEFGDVSNVLTDMENVIPEQQWGLGQASFPSGTKVAYKAGWGPDGSESGPYLVRQSGIVHGPNGQGITVTIAAQDASGSFEAGVADLNRVADWVAQSVPLAGTC
jgi:hypothetical protein